MKRIISAVVSSVVTFSILLGTVCASTGVSGKYKDVKDTGWYAEAINRLSAMDIVNGMADGSFNPQGEVTRAQFVKMLVQAMEYKKIDSLSFEDLKPFNTSKPHWASVYIETALRNGVIVKSEIGDSFYPDVPLVRKDMAMMMFRALKLEPSTEISPFADLTEANGYFTKLYEEYLVRGTSTGSKILFEPEGLTTRAQAAVIISRMVDYKADPVSYKVKMKAEEDYIALVARTKAGDYTEEDIIAKSTIELEKQKADKEYIPEPIFKVEHNPLNALHARITLLNYRDYKNDFLIKMHCTNKNDINTNRYSGLSGLKTIIVNDWKDAQRAGKTVLFDIPKSNGKFTGKTCEYFNYNFKPGTIFEFKITYKRSSIEKSFDYSVTIQ